MNLHKEDDIAWFEDLSEVKPEYTPIKCTTILQFYTLRGKTTKINAANMEGIRYVHYVVFDPNVKKYYYRFWRNLPLDVYYFYRRTLEFSGEDMSVENLRRYVEDGNVWILFTSKMISDTTETLERVWGSQYASEGKVDYRLFYELVRASLDYEDYMDVGKNLVGYKTVCNQYQERIKEIWQKIYEKGTLNK